MLTLTLMTLLSASPEERFEAAWRTAVPLEEEQFDRNFGSPWFGSCAVSSSWCDEFEERELREKKALFRSKGMGSQSWRLAQSYSDFIVGDFDFNSRILPLTVFGFFFDPFGSTGLALRRPAHEVRNDAELTPTLQDKMEVWGVSFRVLIPQQQDAKTLVRCFRGLEHFSSAPLRLVGRPTGQVQMPRVSSRAVVLQAEAVELTIDASNSECPTGRIIIFPPAVGVFIAGQTQAHEVDAGQLETPPSPPSPLTATGAIRGGVGIGAARFVSGAQINLEALGALVRARKGALQHCYESRLRRESTIEGSIDLKFVLEPTGRTSQVEIGGTLTDAAVRSCLVSVVQGWIFAVNPAQKTVISITLSFKPIG